MAVPSTKAALEDCWRCRRLKVGTVAERKGLMTTVKPDGAGGGCAVECDAVNKATCLGNLATLGGAEELFLRTAMGWLGQRSQIAEASASPRSTIKERRASRRASDGTSSTMVCLVYAFTRASSPLANRASPQSALFNLHSLVLVLLLLTCTSAYVHQVFPRILDSNKDGLVVSWGETSSSVLTLWPGPWASSGSLRG